MTETDFLVHFVIHLLFYSVISVVVLLAGCCVENSPLLFLKLDLLSNNPRERSERGLGEPQAS